MTAGGTSRLLLPGIRRQHCTSRWDRGRGGTAPEAILGIGGLLGLPGVPLLLVLREGNKEPGSVSGSRRATAKRQAAHVGVAVVMEVNVGRFRDRRGKR